MHSIAVRHTSKVSYVKLKEHDDMHRSELTTRQSGVSTSVVAEGCANNLQRAQGRHGSGPRTRSLPIHPLSDVSALLTRRSGLLRERGPHMESDGDRTAFRAIRYRISSAEKATHSIKTSTTPSQSAQIIPAHFSHFVIESRLSSSCLVFVHRSSGSQTQTST